MFTDVEKIQIDQINNPWKEANIKTQLLEVDKEIYEKEELRQAWAWDNPINKLDPKNQFPLPINGNLKNAKYLLLYSNPASEIQMVSDIAKEKLLKCFRLDEDAQFVIANQFWTKFYTKELNRFFRNKNTINNEKTREFLEQFCFINYCSYSTGTNTFNFKDSEIKNMISKFPSTEFAIDLVKKWIDIKGPDNVFIVRAREYVWRNHEGLFSKLDLRVLEEDKFTSTCY